MKAKKDLKAIITNSWTTHKTNLGSKLGTRSGLTGSEIAMEKKSYKIYHVSDIFLNIFNYVLLTLRRPLRKNLRMMWFFDVSKMTESSFFLYRTSLTPLRFLMRIFWKNTISFFCRFFYHYHVFSKMVL